MAIDKQLALLLGKMEPFEEHMNAGKAQVTAKVPWKTFSTNEILVNALGCYACDGEKC